MSGRTKPRRRRMVGLVDRNPITLALRRAAKLPADEIAEVMAPIDAAFRAMREGVATEAHWIVLAGTVELALAIERQGVIRGLQGHLQAAETALASIRQRAMATASWQATPLYFHEIEAIDQFTWLHREQLQQLSDGEVRTALAQAEALVRSCGGQVVNLAALQTEGAA